MIDTLQMIFFTLVALGLLVTFHEFGHFWVARRCGVRVQRFSIGFGTALTRWTDRHGTEFVIAAIPLGGYVKMVDEREGEVDPQDLPYAFNRKSVWQRMAVVSAGPIANFLLAIVAYWLVFLAGTEGVAPVVDKVEPDTVAARAGLETGQEIVAVDGEPTPTWQELNEQLVMRLGEQGTINFTVRYPDSDLRYDLYAELQGWQVDPDTPNPVADMGLELYTPPMPPVAERVVPGEPAEQAGLQSGDRILSADGKGMPTWSDWVEYVRERPGEAIEVEVARGEQRIPLVLTPKAVTREDGTTIGRVGMSVKPPEWPEAMKREVHYGLLGAATAAAGQTWKTTRMVLDSIGKMVTGMISPRHLSGPITIAKVAGTSAQYGWAAYVGFLALLSVSLGVLNLLPIPVLDGGHLMYFIIEAVKGSPVSERVQMAGYRIGLFLVVGLMVIALYNDVMRL